MKNQWDIFVDLDGVLADFDRHAAGQGKLKPDGAVDRDLLDYQWWVTMPACAGAKEFYDALKKTGAAVKFLTGPMLNEECYSGKAHWIQNFVPEKGKFALRDLIICPSGDKHYLAGPNRILIDDRENNIKDWVAAGGIGIHHTGDFKETVKKLETLTGIPMSPQKGMLIAIGGMSGSGKTTAAASLAQDLPNTIHIDSDRTRKEIFGVAATTKLPPEAYTPEATQRVIDEITKRVKQGLLDGKNVVVSATFLSENGRKLQQQLAQDLNVPFVGIFLQADVSTLFDRVAKRVNDASDAGVDIVKLQQNNKTSSVPDHWTKIDAGQSREDVAKAVLKAVRSAKKRAPRKQKNPPLKP